MSRTSWGSLEYKGDCCCEWIGRERMAAVREALVALVGCGWEIAMAQLCGV